MIIISTSQFLSTIDIDDRLKKESFIKSICDDIFDDKSGIIYLIRCGYYKLEFCFSKEHIFIYFMVELYENKRSQNKSLSFVDDLNLFSDKNVINELVNETIDNDYVKIKNIEIYLSDGKIESLYLLSSETI